MGIPSEVSHNHSISSNNMINNWVIPLRTPLRPICTTTSSGGGVVEYGSGTTSSGPTTPTSEGSRIPSKLPCPPAPRKRKPSPAASNNKINRCKNNSMLLVNGKNEFFITPDDLEALFIQRRM